MKIAKQWPKRVIRNDRQEASPPQAAGVMLMHAGRVLMLKRAADSDHAGKWCFPGGGVEPGETPEQAAIRECREETGIRVDGALSKIHYSDKHGAGFTTYLAHHSAHDEATLNDEHTAHAWVRMDEMANYDLHPGVAEMIGSEKPEPETELEAAQMIRDGKLPSPQYYGNMALFDLRITGTGMSFREGSKEYVIRKPEHYLTDEFLARCNGLIVILEHPEKQAVDSAEFSARIIGTIVLPYIKGNEVWGIAKIYDAAAAKMMAEHQLSTSPSVVFKKGNGNESMELEGGNHLLIEGKPSLLDHLAIVETGVWDKGGKPSGIKREEEIRADANGSGNLTEKRSEIMELNPEQEAKKDAGAEGGEVLSLLKGIAQRMDAIEAKISQLESAEAPEPAPAAHQDAAVPAEHIAAMEKRVDALEAKTAPVPEGEAAAMADAQCKADSAYAAHGMRAPAPMMGESLLAYRKRLATKMQEHSPQMKGVSLAAINDGAALGVMEGIIYADAAKAAAATVIPEGTMMESVRVDDAGRRIREFKGSPSAWTAQFKAPRRRLSRIQTNH